MQRLKSWPPGSARLGSKWCRLPLTLCDVRHVFVHLSSHLSEWESNSHFAVEVRSPGANLHSSLSAVPATKEVLKKWSLVTSF